ncbi:MAG: hypothetical protein VB102_02025 [Paludibacter sp.]|nr:hypothetical protein [Paludibacter sp.]
MPKQQSHIIRFFKLSLLLFFIAHYSNSTMFYHTHEIDGRIYCHSHFFGFNLNDTGIPVSTHTHTANQFNLIQLFNQISLTANLDIPELTKPIVSYILVLTEYKTYGIRYHEPDQLSLRAPPVC